MAGDTSLKTSNSSSASQVTAHVPLMSKMHRWAALLVLLFAQLLFRACLPNCVLRQISSSGL